MFQRPSLDNDSADNKQEENVPLRACIDINLSYYTETTTVHYLSNTRIFILCQAYLIICQRSAHSPQRLRVLLKLQQE